MAHAQQILFVSIVRDFFLKHSAGKKVLEIGSYDVNGSIRNVFNGTEYLGVDLFEGPGVDVVSSGHLLNLPPKTFDVAISSECFEHNPFWVETFKNMYRMTADSGMLIITCASRGRLEHGTTRTTPEMSPGSQKVGWDYYKNLREADFSKSLNLSAMFSKWIFFYIPVSQDLYFVGWKGGAPAPEVLQEFSAKVQVIRKMSNSSSRLMHILATMERWLLVPLTCLGERRFQNFMVPYSKFRSHWYRKIFGRR